MSLLDNWKRVVFSRYAMFNGRAGRAEYWLFVLVNAVVQIFLFALAQASAIFLILYFAFAVAILIPSLALGIRRLHDTGRSGWWLFISLVPCVGVIVLIVFLATQGPASPNQYGPAAEPATI